MSHRDDVKSCDPGGFATRDDLARTLRRDCPRYMTLEYQDAFSTERQIDEGAG